MGIVFFPMRLSDWRKECYVRFRRLYEENLADIFSSANSVGDLCPNSEDSDSISPDPASILSSATETIVIALNSLTSHHTQGEQTFKAFYGLKQSPRAWSETEARVELLCSIIIWKRNPGKKRALKGSI